VVKNTERCVTFRDVTGKLRVVVDVKNGAAWLTDGDKNNVVGRFDRRGVKALFGPLPNVGK